MASKKIQLYTDRDKTIEASPETSANCVILSDGNDLQKVLDNDLTNPTVVHEETSFKVGVGDIDVSSSVVDGEVSRMVVKGQTYQNILPEPSTHVLTNNKEMFKVNEGLDPNVEIVDAVSKSAILKGQTEINRNDTPNTIYEGLNIQGIKYIDIKANIQPNSTYTVFMRVTKNTSQQIGIWGFYVDGATFTGNQTSVSFVQIDGSTQQFGYTGWLKVKIKTKNHDDKMYRNYITIGVHSDLGECDYSFTDVMILDGDKTNITSPPIYFEGMQSVKLPVLTTTGKNLFDGIMTSGQLLNNSVTQHNQTKMGYSEFLPVEEELDIYCSYYTNSNYKIEKIYFYDENKTQIGAMINPKKVTSPKGAKYFRLSITTTDWDSAVVFDDIKDDFNIQVETGIQATSYEPFKTNILTVNEHIELRGIGEVRDELDLLTGEVISLVEEVVLDGSDNGVAYSLMNTNTSDYLAISCWFDYSTYRKRIGSYLSTLPLGTGNNSGILDNPYFGGAFYGDSSVPNKYVIKIEKSKLVSPNLDGFKDWLSKNPVKVQYVVDESIKTVDLSSSGNWEKVVLDGSKDVAKHLSGNFAYYTYGDSSITNVLPYASGGRAFASHILTGSTGANNLVTNYKYIVSPKTTGTTGLCFSLDGSMTAEEAKAFLSQNPITVWYQTQTHLDSTQVKQPIFFKDGHIQLSSGVDNSLIPTLDYQAKTSNSYVMDLMKTNTKYTMKAKSASGTFTIDGTSYGAGTNGTFTTPTSMTNKLLVMSNKTNEEVMILEGDVVSKTIPYFKGIKSAFEDENKIEVLSTGKNLWNATPYNRSNANYEILNNKDVRIYSNGVGSHLYQYFTYNAKPNTKYIISWERATVVKGHTRIIVRLANNGEVGTEYFTGEINNSSQDKFTATFTTDSDVGKNGNVVAIGFYCHSSEASGEGDVTYHNVQIIEGTQKSSYEPYKSNNTKIPLLSPLRSLPNGVCDELIIDRMKKKATLVQRVGKIVFDGKQKWLLWNNNPADVVSGYIYYDPSNMGYEPKSYGYTINDRLPHNSGGHIAIVEGARYTNYFTASLHKSRIGAISVNDTTTNTRMVQRWYIENPMTMYYELATPVVTEIDLENFPLVYKDGHIFLNSEIAPVVEIDYNINQSQQIQSNNETLQRHELDILDLDNLIVSFVNAEYNLRLLKFDMELSMMALAE